MYSTIQSAGANPQVITSGGGYGGGYAPSTIVMPTNENQQECGGYGVMFLILIIIIIAVGALAFFGRNNHETVAPITPIVQSTSPVAEYLPLMMVAMTSQSARQSTIVDSYNTTEGCCGRVTNFDVYKQTAITDRDVLMENCKNRELIFAENARTREKSAEQTAAVMAGQKEILLETEKKYAKSLERENDNLQRKLIEANTNLATAAQFSELRQREDARFTRIESILANKPNAPIAAVAVDPYSPNGAPGFGCNQ